MCKAIQLQLTQPILLQVKSLPMAQYPAPAPQLVPYKAMVAWVFKATSMLAQFTQIIISMPMAQVFSVASPATMATAM